MAVIQELERLGVKVYATDRGLLDPALSWVDAGVSNMEARNISAVVLPKMKRETEGGRAMHRPPFGYQRHLIRVGDTLQFEPGVFVPDEKTAPVAVEMFQRYRDGGSIYAVTQWLNAQTGNPVRATTVMRRLGNPFYAGMLVFNRQSSSKIRGHYAKERHE